MTQIDLTGLRSKYRPPHPNVVAKSIDHIDAAAADFIERSPLFVLATSAPNGTDASPRGGPPGFVRVLDENRLAFGDLSGNNRLDSYTNLVEQPRIGMLFFVPGLDETLRVNGDAWVTDDLDIVEHCAVDGRVPSVAIGVTVGECFLHCAKALRRAEIWKPTSWPAAADRPSPGRIFNDHLQLGVDPTLIEADLEVGYAATMWEPGGDEADPAQS